MKPAGTSGAYTRATLKTGSWLDQNKARVVRVSVIVAAAALVSIGGSIWASNQTEKASVAFNAAMDVYDAPLQQPGQPPIPNVTTYSDAAARARVAYPLFKATADRYSWFRDGKNAEYFAGLTAKDMGNMVEAEQDLNQAAGLHDAAISSLAKMALGGLYADTGRASQAVQMYQQVIEHPSLAVSANAARLSLAGLEETSNPQQARELYAKIKDSAKTTVAGEIATQKLSGK